MLMEHCSALEKVNTRLQEDTRLQRQQYEKCLDKVASQVVQAILVQKVINSDSHVYKLSLVCGIGKGVIYNLL